MRSLTLCTLVFPVCLLACSPAGPIEVIPDDHQAAAVAALERETGASWMVRWHHDLPTPALLEGRTARLLSSPAPSLSAVETSARRFLVDHPALFHLDASPDALARTAADTDELGMVHVRLAQQHQGVPVWNHELGLHFDREGSLVRVEGRYAPLAPLGRMSPDITTEEARAAALAMATARAAAPGSDGPPTITIDDPLLVVDALGEADTENHPEGAPSRLAWRLEAATDDARGAARTAFLVDAHTGEVYRHEELLDDLRGRGTGALGDRHDFEVASRGKRFYLEDATAGSPMQRVYSAASTTRRPGTEVSSDRIDRWDLAGGAGGSAPGVAVDVAAWLAATQGYYRRVHGRRGAFDRGDGMRATVHYRRGYPNAYWDGKQLVFGDGDGVRVGPLGAALDVVAHEFTHALTQAAARLGHEGESGALNEAISDIFGCFVERGVLGARANWTIGERIALGAGGSTNGLRDLSDPHHNGAPSHLVEAVHAANDRGGVHANSGIVGHAAYLMSQGGTHRASGIQVNGIGADLAERVWYRALTRYLGPSSDFRDAADATVTAARELAGARSAAALSVVRAWQAVGVLSAR